MTDALLSVRGLCKRFGGLAAVSEVDFDLRAGQILGVIGPNGAGKSTTFNMIAGALSATSGSVQLINEELLGKPAHAIARRGLLRTFQHNRLFAGSSVIENVMIGAHTRMRSSLLSLLAATSRAKREESREREHARAMLEFVGLSAESRTEVSALSFGQGRMLEVARALAAQPKLILLDEPAAGLTPLELDRLAIIIRGISARGIAVLLIEHDMKFLLPLAQRICVLNFGKKIAEGTPSEIRDNALVRDAYLGRTA